jgi:hypothetical protein
LATIPQHLHGLGKQGIAIVGHAGLAEILRVDLAVETAGAVNLDPVREPVEPGGCVGSFIGAVQHCISRQLLQSNDGIIALLDLRGLGPDITGNGDIGIENLVQLPKQRRHGTGDFLLVTDHLGPFVDHPIRPSVPPLLC